MKKSDELRRIRSNALLFVSTRLVFGVYGKSKLMNARKKSDAVGSIQYIFYACAKTQCKSNENWLYYFRRLTMKTIFEGYLHHCDSTMNARTG